MAFAWWKLGAIVNIAVIAMVSWIICTKPQDHLSRVLGPPGFAMKLLLSVWMAVALLSLYVLIAVDARLAVGLYALQVTYKTVAFFVLDPAAKNPITRTNLAVLPVLAFSLYSALASAP